MQTVLAGAGKWLGGTGTELDVDEMSRLCVLKRRVPHKWSGNESDLDSRSWSAVRWQGKQETGRLRRLDACLWAVGDQTGRAWQIIALARPMRSGGGGGGGGQPGE